MAKIVPITSEQQDDNLPDTSIFGMWDHHGDHKTVDETVS